MALPEHTDTDTHWIESAIKYVADSISFRTQEEIINELKSAKITDEFINLIIIAGTQLAQDRV